MQLQLWDEGAVGAGSSPALEALAELLNSGSSWGPKWAAGWDWPGGLGPAWGWWLARLWSPRMGTKDFSLISVLLTSVTILLIFPYWACPWQLKLGTCQGSPLAEHVSLYSSYIFSFVEEYRICFLFKYHLEHINDIGNYSKKNI